MQIADCLHKQPAGEKVIFIRPVALLIVSMVLIIACQSALAVNDLEWVLEQKYEGKGDVQVFIAPKEAAVYNKKAMYKAIAKAPDWRVHIFRMDQKTEWTSPLKRFNGKMLTDPFAGDVTMDVNVKAVESGHLNGLRYTRYLDYYNKGEVSVSSEIVTAPQVTEFLSRYFDCPDLKKVPLIYVYEKTAAKLVKPKAVWLDVNVLRSTRSGRITKLKTTAWKKTTYQQNDFALPQNYKQVAKLTDITYSPGQQEVLTETLNGLGFTTVIEKTQQK